MNHVRLNEAGAAAEATSNGRLNMACAHRRVRAASLPNSVAMVPDMALKTNSLLRVYFVFWGGGRLAY